MYCINCGEKLEDDVKVCPKCGNEINPSRLPMVFSIIAFILCVDAIANVFMLMIMSEGDVYQTTTHYIFMIMAIISAIASIVLASISLKMKCKYKTLPIITLPISTICLACEIFALIIAATN